MTAPKNPDDRTEQGVAAPADARFSGSLRSRLKNASQSELVALVERLAAESEDLAARIDYVTDPRAAGQALLRRIGAVRSGRRFVGRGESRRLAEEIAGIGADIRADVLPADPIKAVALADKLFSLDRVVFDRADDSDGHIGEALREACLLWLDAAAAVRLGSESRERDWMDLVYGFYQENDYGIRESLLEEGHRLLQEGELRSLASRFESDARRPLDSSQDGDVQRYTALSAACAVGLVARALRDPRLYERSILIRSPEPNGLQANEIARRYIECNDGAGALRWIGTGRDDHTESGRLDLLVRAYELLGDRDSQIEVRRELYRRAPGLHSFLALERLLPEAERVVLRAHACQEAGAYPDAASAAELLFALGEPALAEKLIVERCGELDGRNYVALTALANTAKASGRPLAATVLLRNLVDAILARGYIKAYGHAADYLIELRALSSGIADFRGQPSHEDYQRDLAAGHARKSSFWKRVEQVVDCSLPAPVSGST